MEISRDNAGRDGPARRRLGQLLVDGDFISPQDLDEALEEQKRSNLLLGEVLVRKGVLDPLDLKAALTVQTDLGSFSGAVRAAAGNRQMVGDLLVQSRRITPAQLERALREQHRTGERLGEVLLRQGYLAANELAALLLFQSHQGGDLPPSGRLRLGEILVATGQITRGQLVGALERQKTCGKAIGDLLVESGALSPRQVAHGLSLQRKLLTAALAAALSLASVGGAGAEDVGAARGSVASGSTRITVTATVPGRATVSVLHQVPTFRITEADIARGFVDVPSASRIEVRDNLPQGYLLVFEGRPDPSRPVDEVSVSGLEREVRIGIAGGLVHRPHGRGARTTDLSYRLLLSRQARPGVYAWPFSLFARPF